jgi:tetratricopeptide (TPR) repeat protein
VRLWYRATLAHKLWREQLDLPHFVRALALFPNDAPILRLSGALHEAFADARVQAVVRDLDLPRGTRLDVESEQAHLRRAEALFRRALDADPSDSESALRYGRTLGQLARHDAAARQLRAASHATDPLLAYYAQLFLGAEEQALGRPEEAGAAYERAAAFFPNAQAPKLALSQLLHESGDRTGARRVLDALFQTVERDHDDPFWEYRLTAGRDHAGLVAAVRRSVGAGHEP